MIEEWAEFIPGYSVSNLGRVRRDSTGRIRILQDRDKRKLGYLSTHINGMNYSVHRLVAEFFVCNPDPENFTVVNHIDNNPSNNVHWNLEWCTQKLNIAHQIKQGTHTSQTSGKSRQQRFVARKKPKSYNKSKYGYPPGVRPYRLVSGKVKYAAGIRTTKDGYIHVGTFDTLEEATKEYRIKYFERYGEFPDY